MRFSAILFLIITIVGCDAQRQSQPTPSKPATDGVEELSQGFSILSWNTESGGSDPATIAKQLVSHVQTTDASIVVLQEVDPKAFNLYCESLKGWDSIIGASGRDDRLMILFDRKRFLLIEHREPNELFGFVVNPGNHRSPLMSLLTNKKTGSRFWVINVHQARDNEEIRNQQAQGLREWCREQGAILIGDWNYDYDFSTAKGNASFTELVRDNVLSWVKPDPMIDSNWADRNKDGVDDYADSIFDGAFVTGSVKNWGATCSVLVTDGDFPDDERTSDHRPVVVRVR